MSISLIVTDDGHVVSLTHVVEIRPYKDDTGERAEVVMITGEKVTLSSVEWSNWRERFCKSIDELKKIDQMIARQQTMAALQHGPRILHH